MFGKSYCCIPVLKGEDIFIQKSDPKDLRGHADAAPLRRGGHQDGEHQCETRPLSREAGDHLRPTARFAERPLQEVGGPDPLPVLDGEQEIREALLQVLFQTLHRRGVPLPEPGDERPPAAEALPVIRGEEDLLDQRLQCGGGEPGQFGQDVPELVDLTALTAPAGEDLAHCLREPRVAVEDEEEGQPETPRGQVVQEGDPRVGGWELPP